jgi:LysR family transcriptional activator of nhaA
MRPSDLNYLHLRYFLAICREGSVQAASRALHVAPSTVSGQVKTLEADLGSRLFERVGRNLVLTPFGEEVRGYAAQIFELGEQLVRAVTSGSHRRTVRVGVSSVLPKLLVREMLTPALQENVALQIVENVTDELLGALGARRLDVVLSDREPPGWITLRGASHLLLETNIAVFGTRALLQKVGDDLPGGLAKVPWIVPPAGTRLRLGLEAWWEEEGLVPDIAAVVDDSALIKALGDQGFGVFAAPERMVQAVLDGYRVECIGVTDKVVERAYAITADEAPTEPAIRAICKLPPLPTT